MTSQHRGTILLSAILFGATSVSLHGAARRQQPVRADTVARTDPVARLAARIAAGEVVLTRDSLFGYLPSLLKVLNIPVSSQGLVFSRTSLQTDKIAPWSPRAVYFNDDVYVGYVQESEFLEIASVDPVAGPVFYILSQELSERPVFAHQTTTCLMCHQSKVTTGGVPGLMVLSTIADRYGYPITGAHEGFTTDATPIIKRWGGWYVTGTHGQVGHSGNKFAPLLSHEVSDKALYRSQINLTTESARTELSGKFDTTVYLSGQSDIVALMVLIHQTVLHNRITQVHDAVRGAKRDALSLPESARLAVEIRAPVRVKSAVEQLVRAMLFVGEASLDGPMRGTTTFAHDFATQGPRDGAGRSLRAFDLERRLFRYPLSFLIYSDSFDGLPVVAKREVYRRMEDVLSGADQSPDFQHLSPEDRSAIRDILLATKPEFAAMHAR